MARLTLEQISPDDDNLDPSSTTFLSLSHRPLSDVSCLASFRNLEKLDLCYNCLTSLESLSSCVNLKWLSLVENKLESLKGIECLPKLTVFNAGKNKLQKIDEIGSVTSLRALILNDNNISTICKLDQLSYLNTLVLSKNPIYEIGDSLMKAKSLAKLSLSNCHLHSIGSSLTSCVELKELRLAHNKITTVAAELARNTSLQILDLGNNLVENWSELKVLSAFPYLKNLNFHGNPIAQKDKLAKKVKKLVPNLRIFNAKPIEGRNRGKRFLTEDTLSENGPPLQNASAAEADKTGKKNARKGVKPSDSTTSKRSTEQVPDLPGLTDHENGSETKSKRSGKGLSKKNIRNPKKDEVGDAANLRYAKKAKVTEEEEEEIPLFPEIDELERPPCNSLNYDKASQAIYRMEKDKMSNQKQDVGLVIEHKREKKSKSINPSALQLLTSKPEVGSGGPSTWDD